MRRSRILPGREGDVGPGRQGNLADIERHDACSNSRTTWCLFELAGNPRGGAKAIMDHARSLAPGKPIRYLIISHHHFDHTTGLREAVAEGVIGHPAAEFLRAVPRSRRSCRARVSGRPRERSGSPFKMRPVVEHLQLKDETRDRRRLLGRSNPHMADEIFALRPVREAAGGGTWSRPPASGSTWADNFRDVVAYYKLDVAKVSPAHTVLPNHPGSMTLQEVEDLLKGGIERAKKHCSEEETEGKLPPGLPDPEQVLLKI